MGMVGCKAEKREIGSGLIFNENMQICSGSESLSFCCCCCFSSFAS